MEWSAVLVLAAAWLLYVMVLKPEKRRRGGGADAGRREAYAAIEDEQGWRDLTSADLDALLKPYRETATALGKKARRAEQISERVYNDGASVSAAIAEIAPWVDEANRAQEDLDLLTDKIVVSTDGGWNKIDRVGNRLADAGDDIIAVYGDLEGIDPVEEELTP